MFLHRRDGLFSRASEYASARDFCAIFHQDMDTLYWIALMLTADEAKAQQCLVAGLEECIEGNAVFKEWARSWSKRVVIKNAIQLMSPRPGASSPPPAIRIRKELGSQVRIALGALTQLQTFDRFVFVMSVLEGYADRDCATLLACSPTEVVNARIKALQHMWRAMEHTPALLEAHDNESQGAVVLHDAEVA